jgi:MFS family permease
MAALDKTRSSLTIIIALMVAEFTAAFELTMVYAALKTLFVVFRDPRAVGWVITAYLLVSAASAAVCARLGDLYGRKRVLVVVLAGAMTGSLISAFSTTLLYVVIGRAIQGMAGAVLPLCFGIAREALPQDKVPYGVSAVGSTAVLAAGFGMLLGGVLVDTFQWHGIFYASASFAVISVLVVMLVLPRGERRLPGHKPDIVGGLLFVPAIFALLLVVTNGNSWGWTQPGTLALGLAGAAAFAGWVYYELRVPAPLINLRLLRNRNLALANIAMVFYALGPIQGQLHAILMQQPSWTGIGAGLSATLAGLYLLPGQLTSLAVAPLTGLICKRLGSRTAIIAGAGTLAIGWVIILLFPSILAALVVSGPIQAIGTTIIYSAIPNLIVATSPGENTAESTGVTQVLRSASQAVGAQIMTLILAMATVSKAGVPGVFPAPSAVIWAIGFVMTSTLLMLATAFLLPGDKPAAKTDEHGAEPMFTRIQV